MSTVEERMQSAIEELEQENRLLRARNTRLEAEAEAKVVSVQEPVAINEADIQKWQGDNDIVMSIKAYKQLVKMVSCQPAAQRQWVNLTDRQIESIFIDAGWSWGEKADMYVPAVREVLKLFKEINE